MVYQHQFLHVFLSLFFFYVIACFLCVSIYLLITIRPLYIEIITNPYVWMLYAPGPLFVGMSVSLLFAGVVRWVYRCQFDNNKLMAKDTWGRTLAVNPDDINSIKTYNIPFMPLSRLTIENAKWSVWVPTFAASEIIKKP